MSVGSIRSELGAETRAAADFFKLLTISLTRVMRGLLFEATALTSRFKNASSLKGSPRSILVRIFSNTELMEVAGEGGDCDLEVALLDPPRYLKKHIVGLQIFFLIAR